MSVSKIEFEEALVFAEDLICRFLQGYQVQYYPATNGDRYRPRLRRHYNDDVLWVVYYFSLMKTKSCYKANYFPRGYNAMDFLHYCGKVASYALRDYWGGILEAGDEAVRSIASCLEDFINSGEFEKNGGWSEIKDLSSRLSRWNVFCSVVCIGNKYGNYIGLNTENASPEPQTAT